MKSEVNFSLARISREIMFYIISKLCISIGQIPTTDIWDIEEKF